MMKYALKTSACYVKRCCNGPLKITKHGKMANYLDTAK